MHKPMYLCNLDQIDPQNQELSMPRAGVAGPFCQSGCLLGHDHWDSETLEIVVQVKPLDQMI